MKDSLKLNGDVLSVVDDVTGETMSIVLSEADFNHLCWVASSVTSAVFSCKNASHEIFMGPYIRQSETGYVVQLIDLYSRNVVTASFPFTSDVNISSIKEYLSSLLRKENKI